MSSHETETGQPAEQKSSVKITMNSKQQAQFEIKAYEDVTVDELTRLRELAVSNYRALQGEFYGTAA